VLLSLVFAKWTHAVFIIIVAPSDGALLLALPLTQEACFPCKHSTFIFLEVKLREQGNEIPIQHLKTTSSDEKA